MKTMSGWASLVLLVVGLLLVLGGKSFEGGGFVGAVTGVVLVALGGLSLIGALSAVSFWLGCGYGELHPQQAEDEDG